MAKAQLVARFVLVADITVVARAKERLDGVSMVAHEAMALPERCEHLTACYGIPSAPRREVEVARSVCGGDPAVDEAKIADPHNRESSNSGCDERNPE